jgi:hypothetical protein
MAHVSNWTFPEIALAISMCSQYMSNPGEGHWDYLVWILDYVYTTGALSGSSPAVTAVSAPTLATTATPTALAILTLVARERDTASSPSVAGAAGLFF